jgi:hypothetical protein
MNEHPSDIRDLIDSEIKRVQIRNHPNFPAWHKSLQPQARQVIDFILEKDVTPELILLAQETPAEDRNRLQFLRVIGAGSPDPDAQSALTNFSLADILSHVEEFA